MSVEFHALESATARVSVVIPTLNEARNLPHVFARLPADLHQVIIVDGHSVDETVAVARRLRPDVQVVMQTAKGKGDALACGFSACDGDIIVMLDADGSTDAAEMARFIEALLDGADFVKGSRFLPGGGSDDLTLTRRLGNGLLSGLVNRLFGTSYTDLCYGYNAFWSRCLASLRVDCDGFEVETLLNIRAARAGLTIREVPSYERSRIHGASNLHVVRDGLRVLRTILRERLDLALAPRPPAPQVAEVIDVRDAREARDARDAPDDPEVQVARLPNGLRR